MRDAAKELQEVRKTPDLPEPTLQYLNEFDKFLKKDKSWNFDGNISYIRDNNIARRRANVCTEVLSLKRLVRQTVLLTMFLHKKILRSMDIGSGKKPFCRWQVLLGCA